MQVPLWWDTLPLCSIFKLNTYLRNVGIDLCLSVLANTTRTLLATLKVTDKFSEATHCLKRQEMVDASNKVFIA